MDSIRAEQISKELIDQRDDGWLIRRYKGHRKSAVAFEGQKDGQQAAFKVFDPELVERIGNDIQIGRIELERSLIDEHHPSMV